MVFERVFDANRLQIVWSTIFSHGSAYLFSLGITKPQSSLIWAIAPICGTIIHPLVGAIADNSRLRWGRRRPFILGGAVGIIMSLTALAWISKLVLTLSKVFGIHSQESIRITTQYGTITCIILLNISIQPLQSGVRALIVDVCPSEQQSIASAWAGRFTGIGNILGYMLGSLPLGFVSHDHEAWRFRYLSLLSVSVLAVTVAITTYFIHEEDPDERSYEPQGGFPPLRILRNVRAGLRNMPPQARRVCTIQFFAWMGWFGFLFYSTSYISRLYLDEGRRFGIEFGLHPELKTDGIRVGTIASLLFAIVALATTIVVPRFARSTDFAMPFSEKAAFINRIGRLRQTHKIWAMSHLLYAMCAFSTFFISSTIAGVTLVGLTGISWGVTQWAPFTLLGEEIATHHVEQDSSLENNGQPLSSIHSGAMMGVHNAAISAPQILAALGSSFIFWFVEGKKFREDGHGIAWILRISGMAALVAAWLAWQLKRNVR